MAVNPLPPQAYTKETLQKAYAWLLTQNSSIKDMAATQDILISLYLKAQRSGESSLDTPSIQNFKQELKSLANLMGDLQTPAPVTATPQMTQQPMPQHFTPSQQAQQTMQQAPPATQPQASGFGSPYQSQNSTTATSTNALNQLDQNSLNALAEVRNTLNLSSDVEALRALLALGYKQFKKLV